MAGLGLDQGPLNNLPRLFALVAQSLGNPVETAEDTVGGGVAVRSSTERAHVHVVLLDRLVVFAEYLQGLRLKGVHHKLHL